jgi:indole-3-glycerol phosphate synthase
LETILDRILQEKKQEIQKLKKGYQQFAENSFPRRSLLQKLQKEEEIAIIAEFKRASPSKGVINTDLDPEEQAKTYESNGASAISVLTDQTFFKGSYKDLTKVKSVVDIPVLCKDFIIDPVQIDAAAASGADLILLIAAAMDKTPLNELYQYARSLDMEVLMEVHNREELDKALITGARLIGVNNRDLKTFNVSLDVVKQLGPLVKKAGAFLISESGIHHKEDVEKVRMAGANGILVGESLMKSNDVKQKLESFRLPIYKEILE